MSMEGHGLERENGNQPVSELEIHEKVLGSHAKDPYLRETNYGLGYLDESEQYLQIKRHRFSLFADAAFGSVIRERAVRENEEEAKRKVALDYWENEMDAAGREKYDHDREVFLREEADTVWNNLSKGERQWAVSRFTDAPADWIPPHRSMMEVQQETSRSRNAHLMDNFYRRVSEIVDNASDEAKQRLQELR